MTEGTYIDFVPLPTRQGRKTKVWQLREKSGAGLGVIQWFPRWRKYVFQPACAVFEETCLREIAQFIEAETAAHKALRRR